MLANTHLIMIENPVHTCLHPRKVTNPYTGDVILVGCGTCSACLNKRSSRYQRLCELESLSNYSECYFLTLTYDNDNLPIAKLLPLGDNLYNCYAVNRPTPFDYLNEDPIYISDEDMEKLHKRVNYSSHGNNVNFELGTFSFLYYPDVQLFLKRLRKKYFKTYGETFRFFCTGEYGPESLRSHWHIILFTKKGIPFFNRKDISEIWGKGRIDFDRSKGGSISYSASYANSASVLPAIYKACKIQNINRHSVQLGASPFLKTYLSTIANPLCTRDKNNREVQKETFVPKLNSSGYCETVDSLSFALQGRGKNFPLDTTFKNRLFPQQYRFHAFSSNPSVCQYYRVYFIYRDFLKTKGIEFDTVKEYVSYYFDSLFRNVNLSSLLLDISFFLDINIDFLDDVHYYEKIFSKVYRFFLMSKNSFRYFSLRDIKLITDSYAKNSLTDNLLKQETLITRDETGKLNISPTLFYAETFDNAMYIESSFYSSYRNEHENIHHKKLLRKRFNDRLNLI